MDGDESTAGEQVSAIPEINIQSAVARSTLPAKAGQALPLDHLLLPVVRARIVPRLLLNLGPAAIGSVRPWSRADRGLVNELVDHLLSPDMAAARDCVRHAQADEPDLGLSVLDLFAQAARELGHRWDIDEASFAEVTIAMSHLSALLHYSSHLFQPAALIDRSICMLMAKPPGDQHSFGLAIAAEHFSRVGFDVRISDDISTQEMLDCLATEPFDIVGLSLSDLRHRQALTDLITGIRERSLNRHVGIIVGGPQFEADNALGELVGADLIVDNLHEGTADVLALVDWLRFRRSHE